MKWKLLHESHGQRTFALVFDSGDEVVSGVKEFARRQSVNASHFSAIGALESAVLGYYDLGRKTYRRNPLSEQVEVLALLGNIVLKDGDPQVHAHIVVGKSDGSAHGGHLLEAKVRPTLEVISVESPEHLRREHDEASGLALIRLD